MIQNPTKPLTQSERIAELELELNNWKHWHEQARLGGQVLAAERDKLLAAITEHHGQKADDRCIQDDDRLYASAGLTPCDRRVGSKADMLANCARFIERRCETGFWKSYAELERELVRLHAIDETCQSLGRELADLKRGEFICSKCGLRKDGEHEKGEF